MYACLALMFQLFNKNTNKVWNPFFLRIVSLSKIPDKNHCKNQPLPDTGKIP
jgi:hypothetical protein